MQSTILAIIIPALATLSIGRLLIRKAMGWKLVDLPNDRKVHASPTPRTGGLAMVLGGSIGYACLIAIGTASVIHLPWQTWTAGLGFIVVGALDDRHSFHPRQKFWVLLCLSALAACPWVLPIRHPGIEVHWASHIFTPSSWLQGGLLTMWFMAVPNAVNIEDAINGYMGGFTLIIMVAAALFGVNTWMIAGCLFGFLILNWPKASHFMGDAGSLGCGFFIAEVLLRAGGHTHPALALALTAPISMDVAMGMIRRLRLRQGFFVADRSTCPHHMLALFEGSTAKATTLLWINAAAFYWTWRNPLLLGLHVVLYGGALTLLNRRALFSEQRQSQA